MGLCGYFCEWANKIKARKFVPQQKVAKLTSNSSFRIDEGFLHFDCK